MSLLLLLLWVFISLFELFFLMESFRGLLKKVGHLGSGCSTVVELTLVE